CSAFLISFQSPLVQAIFSRNTEDVTFLLDHKEDVNSLVVLSINSPVMMFLQDVSFLLLRSVTGANINAKDQGLLTPLHRAAASRNERAVELLLKHSVEVNTRDKFWHTPLHMAAANWATGCAEALLPHVCSLDITDRSGRTPLHHAAHSGHGEMVNLFLSKGANVSAKDKKERQPIHWAAYLGHVEVMKLLVSHSADVTSKDKRGYTPLHAAAAGGQLDVVRYLLRLGMEIDEPNLFGNTALHMACHTGQDTVATELVNCGANINQPNYHGNTPLHLAAGSSSGVLCLELLVNNGADVNMQNTEGKSPLHMAAMYGRFTGSQILIQNGGEVDCVDMNGNTPLHVAARYGQELLISTLLTNGADKSRQGIHGMLPLHLAALYGFPDCCRKLLSNGQFYNLMPSMMSGEMPPVGFDINIVDDHGRTCLHAAASGGNVECLNLLLNSGAELDMKDSLGRSPLHYAAANGNSQCTISLVRAGAEANELDLTGCSPLHYAAASHTFCGTNSQPDFIMEKEQEASLCLDYLLDNGANPTLKNSKGYSAVHYAAAYGNKQHLELLLEISFNCLEEVESNIPVSPLHLAAYYGHCEALRLLCETLVSLDVRDIEGQTALHLAAQKGFSTCVEVLLKHQASYTLKEHKHKWTPLHAAGVLNKSVNFGQVDCLLLLVNREQSADVIDSQDTRGHEDCVSALLEHGASALCRDSQGRTPLHLAASRGHTELLHTLLTAAKKADPLDSMLDHRGYTPTHWAAYHGHEGCLHILLENKVFSNQEGNLFTPLHFTVSIDSVCSSCILMYTLLECRTPLHAAAYSGNVAGLQLVLAQRAEVNAVDHSGCSALMVAADCGQTMAVEFLLHNAKPDLTLVDVNNNTALHLACSKCAGEFLIVFSFRLSLVRCSLTCLAFSCRPLHIAARKGLATVVQVLLSRGAAVMAVDEEGHTPALACAPNKNVADCLALILSTMKPFPPREAGTGPTTNFCPILKNCGIAATCGSSGNLCHA
uniref:Ankyrin repeat domain 52 n=1 Tax=Amphiprion ocellaris TaxID=80972 RepID=A0AAQ5YZ00_AMPOC